MSLLQYGNVPNPCIYDLLYDNFRIRGHSYQLLKCVNDSHKDFMLYTLCLLSYDFVTFVSYYIQCISCGSCTFMISSLICAGDITIKFSYSVV